MISREKLNNIHKLSLEEVKQILYECIEALGLSDINEAKEALGISRGRIYQKMNENNSLQLGIHKLPMINLML